MKKLISLISFVLLLTVSTGCSAIQTSATNSEKNFEFIISSNQPDSHPTVIALKNFAKSLEEVSNGTMKAEVYSSGVLGSDRETLELVQFGVVDMTAVGVSTIEAYEKTYSTFSVPYLFDNKEHYYRVMDSDYMNKEIFQRTASVGFIVKTWFDAGARSFYTKDKQIIEPSDLNGLKMRTLASPTLMKMVSLMGGNPTPLDWGEVYAALQQGVIDGLENNELALTVNKHAEVAKEFSNTKHLYAPDVLIVNKKTYDKLSENQRQLLDEELQQLSLAQRKLWDKATEEAINESKEKGVHFTDPDIEAFKESVQPMHKEVESDFPEFYEVINSLKTNN